MGRSPRAARWRAGATASCRPPRDERTRGGEGEQGGAGEGAQERRVVGGARRDEGGRGEGGDAVCQRGHRRGERDGGVVPRRRAAPRGGAARRRVPGRRRGGGGRRG